MTDNRRMWGGVVGVPQPRKNPSKHKKNGYTYEKRASPPAIIRGERLRVAKRILDSLGKE